MKIVATFVYSDGEALFGLLSAKFNEKEELSTFEQMVEDLNNPIWVRNFVKARKELLKDPFHKKWGRTENSLALQVRSEINRFLTELAEAHRIGKTELCQFLERSFDSLHASDRLHSLRRSKLKPIGKKSLVRIYAVRISPQLFIITGGGIKLTHKIEEDEMLKTELRKLEVLKSYLEANNIYNTEQLTLLHTDLLQ